MRQAAMQKVLVRRAPQPSTIGVRSALSSGGSTDKCYDESALKFQT
jgi:hypothetical protein